MYKIILIDDDKFLLSNIKKHIHFEELNLELTGTYENGKDALDIIKKNKPDIVISDIDMPGISGLELLDELGKLPKKPIVILLTGFDTIEYAKKAVLLKAFAYLTKPAFPPEITDTLRHAVSTLEVANMYDPFELQSICEKRSHSAFKKLIGEIASKVHQSIFIEPRHVKTIAILLLSDYIEYFLNQDIDILNYHSDVINNMSDSFEIVDYLKLTIGELESIFRTKFTVSSRIVEQVKEYTDQHFSDESLSINTLSSAFNISPNYLRTLFKKEYDISYKEYLAKVRLNKANELIQSRAYKVYEIASMVGYKDVHQFRIAYKKEFGHTPSGV